MAVSFKCGAGSVECETWELWATAGLTSCSNLAVIPALVVIWQQGLVFEFVIAIFGLLSSFLYHLCEPTGLRVYGMNDGNWHRLDNVGAIMCFANLFIYFMDNRNPVLNDGLKYVMLTWTLIQQERGPWVLTNTLLPIGAAAALPILKHSLFLRRLPDYNWRMFGSGMLLLAIAFIFFARGLKDSTDYLRGYHSAWHVMVSAASYLLWQTLPHRRPAPPPGRTQRDQTL